MTASRLRTVAGVAALAALVACSQGSSTGTSEEGVAADDGIAFGLPPLARREPAGDWLDAACSLPPKVFERVRRDYNAERSPDLVAVPSGRNFFGGFTWTSHSGPWNYLQRVPLVFYGPGHVRRLGDTTVSWEPTVADVAPTVAALVGAPWPDGRPGRALSPILARDTTEPPKLVVTIVWDGGGWNVLKTWPRSWPNLRALMDGGASVRRAIAGSSPSVTPAIHSNLGTGAFPNRHGIVSTYVRVGGRLYDPFENGSPRFLDLTTVGDVHDLATGNAARVGLLGYRDWHIGMLGHGALTPGGDYDDAALITDKGDTINPNARWFGFPAGLASVPGPQRDIKALDREDGELDGRWMGHKVLDGVFSARHHSPAFMGYQTRLLKAFVRANDYGADDVPDLLFVNFKPIDSLGHNYNMLAPQVGRAVEYADARLREIVMFLDRHVGRGEWVLALTADHGQTPSAEATGAWPIDMEAQFDELARHFDLSVDELIDNEKPGAIWLERSSGVTPEEVASYLLTWEFDDAPPSGDAVPKAYADDMDRQLFDAVIPTARMDDIVRCIESEALGE